LFNGFAKKKRTTTVFFGGRITRYSSIPYF
jgi:hypothetical protein